MVISYYSMAFFCTLFSFYCIYFIIIIIIVVIRFLRLLFIGLL